MDIAKVNCTRSSRWDECKAQTEDESCPSGVHADLVGEFGWEVVNLPCLVGHIQGPILCAAMYWAPGAVHLHESKIGSNPVPLQKHAAVIVSQDVHIKHVKSQDV